ncbi:hypothetical protein EXE10_20080 [Acinetobacter sp. WCHAc060033]|nr:hypothetical protein EXE10_20080 [Acinetobacter sp. WCHAc060033]
MAKMGYQLETTALISIDNYNAFRISCIMLILGRLKSEGIRNHLFGNFSNTNFIWCTMDVSWFSSKSLKY